MKHKYFDSSKDGFKKPYDNDQPKDESKEVKEGGELFTGGSWIVKTTDGENYTRVETDDQDCKTICDCYAGKYGEDMTKEEAEANAALIAQSKNMYYALKDAIERMDRARNILHKDDNSRWNMLDTESLKQLLLKATPKK